MVQLSLIPLLRRSLPDPLDGLGQADVVGLELVQADADEDGGAVEEPHGRLAGLGVLARGDVVDDDGLDAEVAVDEQQRAQDGVEPRVQGAAREGGQG